MSTLNVENIKNETADSDSIQLSSDGKVLIKGDLSVEI